MTGDAMEAEFGSVAGWTARVAADLGTGYHIPAACRGSGQPAVLDWLLERLAPRPGEAMIDVGAGLGGPAAYAARQTGVQPVLVEYEPGACRAAARLFGAPVVQADATALPFADATAELTWCLGVLCTAAGPASQRSMVADFPDITQPPPDWTGRTRTVERELHRRYGHTPELTAADEQAGRIGKLMDSGQLTSQAILTYRA